MLPPLMSNRVYTREEMCQRIPDIPDTLCNVYEMFCTDWGAWVVVKKVRDTFYTFWQNEF